MKHMLLLLAIIHLTAPLSLAGNSPHVKARLVADSDQIQPGKPFTIAVVFDIDPDWHIYWKNPGDAGQATLVKLTLPAGFSAGEIRYPAPTKFVQPGDIVAYGYETQTALLATITPPAAGDAAKPAEIAAAVSWLVCNDVCIPGKADLHLTLPNATLNTPNTLNTLNTPDAALIGQYTAQVPADFTDHLGTIAAHADAKPQDNHTIIAVSVDIAWPHPPTGDGVFLPASSETYNFTNAKITANGNTAHLQFTAQTLAGKKPAAEKLEITLNYPASTSPVKAVRFWLHFPTGQVAKPGE